MTKTKTVKKYSLQDCPFYKARSLTRIAECLTIRPRNINHPRYKRPQFNKLLHLTKDTLEEFTNDKCYKIHEITDKKGKKRKTEVPIPELKLLQRRMVDLFKRIDPPPYLYSATKKRSYVDNGKQHANGERLFKIDIKQFFPNTLYGYVYNFYRNILLCEKHVATVLAKLCTYDGHLPTGSPLSPILSFYAHKPMFDKIYQLALDNGCIMTLYIDDIHISGERATDGLLWEVQKIIHQHKMGYHKVQLYKKHATKTVTGTIIVGEEVRLRNRSHRAIHDGIIDINNLATPKEKLKFMTTLMGKANEAKQIDPAYTGKVEYLRNQKKHLMRELKKIIVAST